MPGTPRLLPRSLALFLKGESGSVEFAKAHSVSSAICFTTSPLPVPTPHLLSFSWAICPFGRKETTPTRAEDSGALPSERLLGQWLCPVPYQP